MRYRRKKPTRRKTVLLISLSILVIIAGVLIFVMTRENNTTDQIPNRQDGINYDPPTEEEKKAVDETKQELGDGQPAPPPPPIQDGRTGRPPIITYAQQFESNVEVTGYVPGVLEEGGVCKLELSNGSLRITKESAGFEDVNRTSCTPFSIPVSEFSKKGTWTAMLSYSSNSTTGTSSGVQLEVK